MRMNVNPPRHNKCTCRVDLTMTATDVVPDGSDAVPIDSDVSCALRSAGAVNDGATTNNNIWHRMIPSNRTR